MMRSSIRESTEAQNAEHKLRGHHNLTFACFTAAARICPRDAARRTVAKAAPPPGRVLSTAARRLRKSSRLSGTTLSQAMGDSERCQG